MERGFRNTTTTQSDRTRVGGGNIGGANFSAISEVDPGYAGKVWGVMNESVASRLTNLTTPETAWTPMLGSATQLKSNPIVFDKLKRAFVDSMKKGNLSDELAAKINHNLALDFGEGVDIRDPKIWQLADTFDKRGALADAMMGQGIAPKKGGVALGGELRGGAIFNPSEILIRETERALLHPMHGGDVPTFAAGPRAFSLAGTAEYRPDLHPGFPTLLHGKDLGVNMIPTPTEVYLPDWHRNFKAANPSRKPSHYDLALGVKHQGLPSQALNDDYIRHLIREGFAEGGEVSLDELNDKYLPPMSSAELLAQIDRSMANSPAPAYGTASSAPDREVTESRNMLERFTSLDTPQDMSLGETAADIAMGFAPGIGTAQGLRDFERARRDDDTLGMVLGAASALPIVGGVVKAARTVGKASKAADDLAALTAKAPLDMSQAARMQRAAEQGLNLDVYHGTHAEDMTEVDPSMVDLGLHVGTYEQADNRLRDLYNPLGGRRSYGNSYRTGANIIPMKVRANNPLSMEDAGDWMDSEQVLNELKKLPDFRGSAQVDDMLGYADEIKPTYYGGDMNWRESPENRELLDEIKTMLIGRGYDSIRYLNQVENMHGSEAAFTKKADDMMRELRYDRENIEMAIRDRMPQVPDPSDPEAVAKIQAYRNAKLEDYATQEELQRISESRAMDFRIRTDPASKLDPNSYIILDPAGVRSINAAFDPAERGSGNLSYAQGGTVRAYDPLQIENIMSSINAPRNYASGGSVLAYNPGRVDAILNQFRGAV